jgi:hypothetical protein
LEVFSSEEENRRFERPSTARRLRFRIVPGSLGMASGLPFRSAAGRVRRSLSRMAPPGRPDFCLADLAVEKRSSTEPTTP